MYKILKLESNQESLQKGDLNIPKDEGNPLYREYLKWVSEGNEAEVVDMTGDSNE